MAARSLDIGRLAGSGAGALMMRTMVAKALLVLDRLNRLDVRVSGAPDGLALKARLQLAEPPKQAGTPSP